VHTSVWEWSRQAFTACSHGKIGGHRFVAADGGTAHSRAAPLLALAPLRRRGIHHGLQVVVAGAYDDGPLRPAHRLAPPHHNVRSAAHVRKSLANAAAANNGEGLRWGQDRGGWEGIRLTSHG
jgi:hypothetical protein